MDAIPQQLILEYMEAEYKVTFTLKGQEGDNFIYTDGRVDYPFTRQQLENRDSGDPLYFLTLVF